MALLITPEERDRQSLILLGLSEEDVAERRTYIGASDANTICGGDDERVHQLWLEKRGEAEPEDLSDNLAVQMGTWTEALNCLWYEKQTGRRVTDRQARIPHAIHKYIIARLDGKTHTEAGEPAVLEAKHVGAFGYDIETIYQRYAPQVAVQMACAGVEHAILSVFSGSNKWETRSVERDPIYEAEVIGQLVKFWAHVQDGTPPVDIAAPAAPIPVSLMRRVDLSTSNTWTSAELDYVQNETAAKAFETAKKDLKGLIEDDVCEAKGKLLTISRSKNGSLRFARNK